MEHVFYIDLKNITTKEALHDLLAKELSLPEHYGHNLDALHDVLTEHGDNWNMIFYNCEDKKQRITGTSLDERTGIVESGTQKAAEFVAYMAKFRKMCAAACKECDGLRIRFF